MSFDSEMMSVTFQAKTKKLQTVVRSWSKDGITQTTKLQQNTDRNTVPGQSTHQTTYQALMCSMTAHQRKTNVSKTVF